MMRRNKTALEIQTEIYKLVAVSELAKQVSGGVYHYGTRPPRDVEREDIVVRFTAGLAGQVSRGVVTVLIFVPDLRGREGRVMDFQRVAELERVASEWVGSTLPHASTGYRFSLSEVIQTVRDEERPCHFISVPLKYEILEII